MIKLIASDLDGTLLQGNATQLDSEIFDIILHLKKKGITFVAASGRQLASMKHLFTPIIDEISYIAENGGLLVHDGEMQVSAEIPPELSFRILDCAQKYPNCKILLSCVSTCYVLDTEVDFYNYVFESYHNDITMIDDFSKIQEPFLKISLQCKENYDDALKYFHEIFHEEIKVVNAGKCWVDFVPFHTNKGIALQAILEKMHLSREEMIAFGDQQNDLEMLEFAGKSYAMANSSDEVKGHADAITDSVLDILKTLI